MSRSGYPRVAALSTAEAFRTHLESQGIELEFDETLDPAPMARPLRPQWHPRTLVRRRHRSWMAAMILATLGWGGWWMTFFLMRLAPGIAPGPQFAVWWGAALGAVGMVIAFFTIRARRVWVLFALIALFANGTLLLAPWLDAEQVLLQAGQVEDEGP